MSVQEVEKAMNLSISDAEGSTRLEIVIIGLLSKTLVAVVGVFAQVNHTDLGTMSLVKADPSAPLRSALPVFR